LAALIGVFFLTIIVVEIGGALFG